MDLPVQTATTIFPAAMIAAGFLDARTRTIPNVLTVALAAAFVALAPWAGLSGTLIAGHLAVAALALIVGVGLFAAGWLGGGDGKLIAATALWLGPAATPAYLIYAALAGGALALALLAARALPVFTASMARGRVVKRGAPAPSLPYGVALAAGGLLAFPASPWASGL